MRNTPMLKNWVQIEMGKTLKTITIDNKIYYYF
jgi:hypothetical protein